MKTRLTPKPFLLLVWSFSDTSAKQN
ncbi:hypothetical protein EMIT047CA2_50341 [Pseudomonas soli]